MIDCGQSTANGLFLGKHLKKLNARRLDQLVDTNYDEDHVSGFPDLVEENIDIGWLCHNQSVKPADIKRLKTEDGMGAGSTRWCDVWRRSTRGQRAWPRSCPRPRFRSFRAWSRCSSGTPMGFQDSRTRTT